jgi:hypothetical protein
MAGKFQTFNPAGIWIVSLYQGSGITKLNFPSSGVSYDYITFGSVDQNEDYLTRFDSAGIRVWLQVEPGAANIDTLISLVLNRYQHHPCVAGFGIDVEWYNAHLSAGGQKVTDVNAERWERTTKSFDTNYTLFLKHYGQSWMPPVYRGTILFVDDSQQFSSLSAMVPEFQAWGNKFSNNTVAFQFGYPDDKVWWSLLTDPAQTIGASLIAAVPNCGGIFWVDFTLTQIFPIVSVSDAVQYTSTFVVEQNYPNPFNAASIIRYYVPSVGSVIVRYYNVVGERVAEIIEPHAPAGWNQFTITADNLASGVYVYQMIYDGRSTMKKMIILK